MKLFLFGLVTLVLGTLVLGTPLKETKISPRAGEDYRLPLTVLPISYNLTLKPYLLESDGAKQFTFDGEAFVVLRTTETNLRSITLHSKNLTYSLSELYETANPNNKITIVSSAPDEVTDKLTLNLGSALTSGTLYTLHCIYVGILGDDMHGFYKSYYVDDRNNTKWLGSTQFQTNHARRAFPSFDEPKFKATFDVTLIRHRSFNTVSNTRIKNIIQVDNDYYKDVYQTTPIMSTYLLAFLVSDFNERTDGQFYVIARPEYHSQTAYGFEVGPKLLAEFDKYTNLSYYSLGVDKMHLAAIPDFSAGAMENWGLLTYRERSLLYDEGSTTLSAKQAIAAVISHEQAHMWFGDLVTCDWWGYTWLNEGFARYFQYFMTAVVYPEWELEKQFVVDQIQSVFTMDATNNTNPMSDPSAASPADLSRMFNSISYNKGGSVIRMIRHAIGEANFQKSLQSYLLEFKNKNTIPKNIFDHWKANWPAATVVHADGVLNSFTEQVGYPVLYLDVAEDFKSMTVQQKRFLLKSDDGSNATLLYTIPFTYTNNLTKNFEDTTPKVYLQANTSKVTINFPSAIDWVIGNVQQTGYYRVNYSIPAWHRIHHSLKSANWSNIHEINRAQYVDDLLALARSGDQEYSLSLTCLDYLDTEVNYLPWTAAFNGLNYLAIRLGVEKENFGNYIIAMSRKVYTQLGFEETDNDTTLEIYTRSKVISWNCKYGHKDCISKSLSLFRNLKTTPVPLNIRGAVYCTAMRDGTEADFDLLYNKFKTETVPTEQVLIINNLGCVREPKLVERYFNIIVSDEIRRQDKSAALSSLYSDNAENVSPVFELVTKNFEALATSMGSYSAVASVISNIASRFTTEEQQKQLEDFIEKNGKAFGSSVGTLNAAVTTVKENLAWSNKRLGSVLTYFSNFKSGAATTSMSVLTVAVIAIVSFVLH